MTYYEYKKYMAYLKQQLARDIVGELEAILQQELHRKEIKRHQRAQKLTRVFHGL